MSGNRLRPKLRRNDGKRSSTKNNKGTTSLAEDLSSGKSEGLEASAGEYILRHIICHNILEIVRIIEIVRKISHAGRNTRRRDLF